MLRNLKPIEEILKRLNNHFCEPELTDGNLKLLLPSDEIARFVD